ncbi:MAG: hypothetical protein ISR06_03620 [Synechococcus sp. BS30m-G30]|nr:hypothetical protein [Synechococcus sp.]MBL6887921.1 hypothetical protein [Synechococcus sp. BS30m-G30]
MDAIVSLNVVALLLGGLGLIATSQTQVASPGAAVCTEGWRAFEIPEV